MILGSKILTIFRNKLFLGQVTGRVVREDTLDFILSCLGETLTGNRFRHYNLFFDCTGLQARNGIILSYCTELIKKMETGFLRAI